MILKTVPITIIKPEMQTTIETRKRYEEFAKRIYDLYREHWIELEIRNRNRRLKIPTMMPFERLEDFMDEYSKRGK